MSRIRTGLAGMPVFRGAGPVPGAGPPPVRAPFAAAVVLALAA